MQNVSNAGAQQQMQLAQQAAGYGNDVAGALYAQGAGVTNYAVDSANQLYGAGAGIGAAGQSLYGAAGQAAGRIAPTTNFDPANQSLVNAQSQTQNLWNTGLASEGLAYKSMHRDAPALNLDAQSSALLSSQNASGQLGIAGDRAINAGLNAQNRGVYQADWGRAQQPLNAAGQNASALAGLEAQQGPSAAQAQLMSATNQAMAQQTALARSGRGYGQSASALAEAQRANAATGVQAANASAALRAQEDAAWRQRQAANLGASSQLQQALGAQYGQQAQADVQSILQSQAQNDAATAQLMGTGIQAMQGRGALEQGAAGQYGQQQQLLAQTQLQQQAQNDAQLATMMGLSQQGYGQAVGAQQNIAAQQAQQAQFGTQTQLAQQAQNDAYASQLYGLGLQGQTAGQQAQLQAAQLGVSGAATGADIINQGGQIGLQGTQLAGGLAGQATAQQMGGLSGTAQIAQAQNNADIAHEQGVLQAYGIKSGVAIQNAAMQNQLIGSGIQAAGTALGAMAMMSDIRAKKDIRPVSEMEAFLSPGDSLLRSDSYGSAGEQIDPNDPYALEGIPKGGYGMASPSGNVAAPVRPHDEDAYAASMAKAAAAERNSAASERAALGMASNAVSQLGEGFNQRPLNPILQRYLDMQPGGESRRYENLGKLGEYGAQQMMSDERAKEALHSAEMSPGYSYRYKDPETHGEGEHFGPMAQDLARTPAGRSTLSKDENGMLRVDTGKLALVDHAGLGELARQVAELKQRLEPRRRSAA